MRNADKQAFESRIWITPGCWLWQGDVITKGYGRFSFGGGYESAHRLSFRLYVGPIPSGHVIRHSCDNPICVNPDHLQSGTQKENIQDAVSRGRMSLGERNGRATITAELVLQIRDLLDCGLFTHSVIGHFYGVKRTLVSDIRNGRCWSSV